VGKQPAKRGPKTVPGRLRASMNSTKHGILSPRPVVHHYESETGWKGHRDSILKSLDPQNGMEQVLAERVALCSWRLNRVAAYETEQILRAQEAVIDEVTGARKHKLEFPRVYAGAVRDMVRGTMFEDVIESVIGGEGKLSELAVDTISPATLPLDQAQNAREKYEGISALLEAGKDRKIGGHAFWWLISAGPEYAADLAFYQEDSEERIAGDPDEDEVAVKARTLERKLVARLGDRKELTVGAFLEHFDWLVEEAEVAHDGRYEPRERLLKKLHGMAQVGYNNALERARKTDAEITDLRGDRMLPSEADLQRIARYEAHLSREMYKSLHELEALQGRRAGQPAPLARFDVHGLPTS
jgi:hypothetical protein